MSEKMRIESTAVGRTYGMVQREEVEGFDGRLCVWYHGYVITRYGIVGVYSEAEHTVYRFVHRGRDYYVYDGHGRNPRGLAVMATRVARKIVEAPNA